MSSHRAAQAAIYADQLQEANIGKVTLNTSGDYYVNDYSGYDSLYVYHGNDWGGALNLFGGLKGYANIYNFVNFANFKGDVYSLDIDMPDYYTILKERIDKTKEKGGEVNEEWDQIDWDNLKRICETAETIKPNDLIDSKNFATGDSHAISMYRPGWKNTAVPFKTLHGALKQGLKEFVPRGVVGDYNNIEFYFGNIDIRHHLCRQDDPAGATKKLVDEYVRQAADISYIYECAVTLYEPLPIENESRKLPKTGYYKGTPFYGSWKERNEIRKIFKEELKKQCGHTGGRVHVYEWIGEMMNSKGELDFEYMEKPQSVHLSRQYYPHWQGCQWSHAPYREYIPLPEKTQLSLEDFFV